MIWFSTAISNPSTIRQRHRLRARRLLFLLPNDSAVNYTATQTGSKLLTRSTIDDVARHAGVSIKTVSRVINKESNVREATRKKVAEAAEALDYRPSLAARGLAGSKTYLVALLYDSATPNYLVDLQAGILSQCTANAYGLVLQPVDTETTKLSKDVERFLAHSPVDGLILTPPVCDQPELIRHLKKMKTPFISVAPFDIEQGLAVAIDDRAAAREMTDHLISSGHRRIAFIKGHPTHGAGGRRLDGYRDALEAADIPFDKGLVTPGLFTFRSGLVAAKKLLSLDPLPTAIFAANDDMAAAVLQHAHEMGLRTPKDLSVVGFDDSTLSRHVWPTLTTVRQPIREMGEQAAETLLSAIRKSDVAAIQELPFELIIRNSSGPA
jgi:LacI family transcriptional regulator